MAQAKTAVANKPLWADLSSPDAEASRKFYSTVFGWKIEVNPDPQYGGYGMAKVADKQVAGIGPKMSPDAPTAWSIYMGTDQPPYTEFQLGGESVAGGQEMQAMVPPQVPSYWLVYFTVADVDKSFKTATQAGARELVAPMEFPGGRFAILTDPQGASFGLLKMAPR